MGTYAGVSVFVATSGAGAGAGAGSGAVARVIGDAVDKSRFQTGAGATGAEGAVAVGAVLALGVSSSRLGCRISIGVAGNPRLTSIACSASATDRALRGRLDGSTAMH